MWCICGCLGLLGFLVVSVSFQFQVVLVGVQKILLSFEVFFGIGVRSVCGHVVFVGDMLLSLALAGGEV